MQKTSLFKVNTTAAFMESAPETVGQRLMVLMEAEQIDEKDLVRLTGVDVSTVYRWLRDKSKPWRKYLDLIASTYNYNALWLRQGQGEMRGRPNEAREDRASDFLEEVDQGFVIRIPNGVKAIIIKTGSGEQFTRIDLLDGMSLVLET